MDYVAPGELDGLYSQKLSKYNHNQQNIQNKRLATRNTLKMHENYSKLGAFDNNKKSSSFSLFVESSILITCRYCFIDLLLC